MRKIFSLAIILAFVFSASAFAANSVPLSGPYKDGSRLIMATGGEGGEYYSFGSILAEAVGRTTSTNVRVATSGGSIENIEALESGKVHLAFIQSDAGFYAARGMRLFNKKFVNFSTVADLYFEPVQIITLNPSIERIEDLRGKTVSVGAEGSGTYFNAVDVFSAYEMDINTDINPVYESFTNSVEALKAGKIDAAFIVAGVPTKAVSDLAGSTKIFIVSLDDKHIMDLIAKSPYYAKVEVPKSTYTTDDNDVTVAVRSIIVARDDVPANDVYNFMYGVFENLDAISQVSPIAGSLSLKFAASYPAIPYHPGSVKYLGEKGILVSGKAK